MSINVGTAEAYLNLNYNGFTQGIQTATQQLNTFMDNTQSSGDRIEALGGAITSVGGTLTKTLTPAVTAIGAASVKVAADFEEGMSQVQAISGATGEDMELLSAKAKELGANTKFSATEASEAFSYMAMAGWKTTDMLAGITGVMDLAAASGENLGVVSDIVTDALTAFGLSASDSGHFADVLAAASSNANTNVSMLGESFKYIAPVAGSMNYSIEETAVALGILANNGIKASQAGTTLRSGLAQLLKPSDTVVAALSKIGLWVDRSEEGLEDLNLAIMNTDGTSKTLTETMDTLRSAFSGLDEAQKSQLAAQIFGTEAMSGYLAIINTSEEDYNKLTNAINNCDGATAKMAETMQDNLKGKITQLKSALEGAGIAIGEKLIPALTDIVKGITNTVSSFNKLDEGTQKSIVKFGLIAAAAGPVISVIGKLVTGIGALVNIFSAASGAVVAMSSVLTPLGVVVGTVAAGVLVWKKNQDLMNGTVLDSKENMGLFERALASLQGETVYTKEELQELGYTFDDITDVNKDLQDAIYESKRDLADFKMVLHDTTLDNTFTQEEANNLVSRVDGAFQSCLEAIEEKYGATQDAMSEMFSVDGVINENESKILTWYQTQQDQMTAKASQLQEEINQIIANRTANGGELTEQEINQIQNRYAKIKQIELDCLADNEYERIRAQQEFILESNDLDLEGLSELVKNRREKYDEQNKDVLANYNTQIEYLKNHLGEMDYETRIAAEAQIEQLEKDRDKELEVNREYYSKDIDYVREHYGDLVDQIDLYSGNVKSRKDRHYEELLNKDLQYYANTQAITETGLTTLYNTTTGTWDMVYAKVDETTGQLVGIYDIQTGKVKAMTEEIAESLTNEAREWYNLQDSTVAVAIAMGQAWVDSTGRIVNANGDVIGSLRNVTDNADGTKTALIDLDGRTYRVNVDGDGAITILEDIQNRVNSLPSRKDISINVYQNGNTPLGGPISMEEEKNHYATGTENAMPGISSVAEYGPELVLGNDNASLYTSRSVVGLEGGETIYNARQTSDILRGMDGSSNDDVVNAINNTNAKLDVLVKKIDKLETGRSIHADVMNFVDQGSKKANLNMIKRTFESVK